MAEVRVCALSDLAEGKGLVVDAGGERVALFRLGDDLFAIGDRCSHAEASLAEGEVFPEECEVECPRHGSLFDLRTGKPRTLPATAPVPVYAVRTESGDVFVALSDDDGRDSGGRSP